MPFTRALALCYLGGREPCCLAHLPMKERVFRFRAIERSLVSSRESALVLDVGCGRGDNLRRLRRYGAQPFGIDPATNRLRTAREIAPVTTAWGEALPWRAETFDLIYVSHVLHHAMNVESVLRECYRVLRPGGVLFLIETVDDSPLMRLARKLQPLWEGDAVLNRFRYRDLRDRVGHVGFKVGTGETFNWMYFAWELIPLRFSFMQALTPLFILIEVAFSRLFDRWGGHCWLIAERPGPPVFAAERLEATQDAFS